MITDFITFVQFTIVLQGVLLIISLRHRTRLWPLMVFLTCLVIHMSSNLAENKGQLSFLKFTHLFSFLYGPMLFLLVKSLVYQHSILKKQTALHFLPAIILFPIPFLHEQVNHWAPLLALISITIYFIVSFRLLFHYQDVKSKVSTVSVDTLKWLENILSIISVVGIVEIGRVVFSFSSSYDIQSLLFLLTNLGLLVFTSFITMKSIKHAEFLEGITTEEESLVSTHFKSDFNPFPQLNLDLAIQDLSDLMSEKRLYLKPNLTLQMMAEQSGYSAKEVSYVVNNRSGSNFNDFINDFRIQHACKLIQHIEEPSILNVMYDSGFNSKSSFYSAFKKRKKVTPNQFRSSKS